MKIKWTEEQTAAMLSNLLVVIIGILLYLFFSNYESASNEIAAVKRLLFPFAVGFVIAFLLSKPVNKLDALQKRFFIKKQNRARVVRNISIFISIICLMSIVFFLLYITLPELSRSVTLLVEAMPEYLAKAETLITGFIDYLALDPELAEQIYPNWTESIYNFVSYLAVQIPSLINYSWQFLSSIFNLVIGLIVAVYILTSKEKLCAQIKKTAYGLLGEKKTTRASYIADTSNRIFTDFLVGKVLDSAIIGLISFICLSLMNMPYTLLISVVVGITNIIPFFGPFIGAIPSAFLILLVNPMQMVFFIIFIFLLQQFDGNILGPFILGDATGLDSLWVIVAILVGGGLFGFVGMIIGVPTLAVIYIFFKEHIENKLSAHNLPTQTTSYYPPDIKPIYEKKHNNLYKKPWKK